MWGGQGGQGNWGNSPQGNPWGQQGMQMGGGHGHGGMQPHGHMGNMGGGGGHHQQWQQNAFYNQNQRWGQGGYNQMPQWQNKHNVYIPPI